MTAPLNIAPEVAAAKAEGRAIVALESTIITHGMPYPQNLEVARQVEADIRAAGATPATIAVINGTLHAGLTDQQLEDLAQAKNVAKVSRADMPVIMAKGGMGHHQRLHRHGIFFHVVTDAGVGIDHNLIGQALAPGPV